MSPAGADGLARAAEVDVCAKLHRTTRSEGDFELTGGCEAAGDDGDYCDARESGDGAYANPARSALRKMRGEHALFLHCATTSANERCRMGR